MLNAAVCISALPAVAAVPVVAPPLYGRACVSPSAAAKAAPMSYLGDTYYSLPVFALLGWQIYLELGALEAAKAGWRS